MTAPRFRIVSRANAPWDEIVYHYHCADCNQPWDDHSRASLRCPACREIHKKRAAHKRYLRRSRARIT